MCICTYYMPKNLTCQGQVKDKAALQDNLMLCVSEDFPV
jgi:hypothetical protein